MHKQTSSFLLICLATLVSSIWGCSDSSVHQGDDVATVYYNHLKERSYVDEPAAQPQFPGSGELYSENTSVFNLVPANSSSLQKKLPDLLVGEFALYVPPASASKRLASASTDPSLPASSSTSLPSLHRHDVIPASCAGATGTDLRNCLDDLGVASVPQSEHVSTHDPQSLAIEVGQSVAGSVPGKTVQALTTNVSKADRDTVLAKLTDFTNDDPAHANVDIAAFDPFNASGYSLSSVTVSDYSTSDINGDGILDPHSTMITEIVKPVAYRRSPSTELDSCMNKYGNQIDDRYVVKVLSYVHMDHLKPQRQSMPIFTPVDGNTVPPSDFYDSVHRAMSINHSLDANIIKSVYGSSAVLPASSTEYTLMFQIDPGQISGEYHDLLEKIAAAGDAACQGVVEEHLEARTAIISGAATAGQSAQKRGGVRVFYQVPTAYSPKLTGKIAAALTGGVATASDNVQPMRDYCMVDGDGRKVALIDPVSGEVIPACGKFDQRTMAKTLQMTKGGACRDDSNDWTYKYSRTRTERFGRGIQWILTEWVLHNQVGDYKNIHWYQSAWKSNAQVAVRGAKYVLATYLKIQIGAIKLDDPDDDDEKKAKCLKSLLPLIKDIVMKMDGVKIAGFKLSMPTRVGSFLSGSSSAFAYSNPTFDYWLIMDMKDGVRAFLVDRVTDAAAQMLDVTITGWQDISDRSHHGCFDFG